MSQCAPQCAAAPPPSTFVEATPCPIHVLMGLADFTCGETVLKRDKWPWEVGGHLEDGSQKPKLNWDKP